MINTTPHRTTNRCVVPFHFVRRSVKQPIAHLIVQPPHPIETSIYLSHPITLKPYSPLSPAPTITIFLLCSSFLHLHCHSQSTGKNCQRSNSGHKTSKNTILVSSWACQSMKSESLSTPEVRIRRSSGGSEAVKRWDVIVAGVISSGEG